MDTRLSYLPLSLNVVRDKKRPDQAVLANVHLIGRRFHLDEAPGRRAKWYVRSASAQKREIARVIGWR